MEFITVTSIGGSLWSFRKDRIEMVSKRFKFTQEELNNIPELSERESCTIIHLLGSEIDYFCQDSYESIMEMINK